MKNKKMLSIKGILELINEEFNYATDRYSKQKILEGNYNEDVIYAIPAKALRRYIEDYIDEEYKRRHGEIPQTDGERNEILYREGATKGQRYEEKGIYEMLKNENVFSKIKNRIRLKSIEIETENDKEIYIPKPIYEDYTFAPHNMDDIDLCLYYQKVRKTTDSVLKKSLYDLSIKKEIVETELRDRELLTDEVLNYFREDEEEQLETYKKEDIPVKDGLPEWVKFTATYETQNGVKEVELDRNKIKLTIDILDDI